MANFIGEFRLADCDGGTHICIITSLEPRDGWTIQVKVVGKLRFKDGDIEVDPLDEPYERGLISHSSCPDWLMEKYQKAMTLKSSPELRGYLISGKVI